MEKERALPIDALEFVELRFTQERIFLKKLKIRMDQ